MTVFRSDTSRTFSHNASHNARGIERVNLSDKVKYLISVFSFVCVFNYRNHRAMLCSAASLFLAKLVIRIQFRCIALSLID